MCRTSWNYLAKKWGVTSMDAELFISILREALDRIDQKYYRHILWKHEQWFRTIDDIENQEEREELREYLDRYGERVFCYELYHQIRKLMDDGYVDCEVSNDNEDVVLFQAELKKDQIGNIIHHFPQAGTSLDKVYIPDFLLHSPGNFRHQELIIEVKSNPYISKTMIKADLLKIYQFIRNYKYRYGIFLTVNSDPSELFNWLVSDMTNSWLERCLPHRERIVIICKQCQGADHIEWHLDKFLGSKDMS
jgi:hypothetical protein